MISRTMQITFKIRKVISSVKEYDTDNNIKIALSSIIHRSEHDFEDKINETITEHWRRKK